LTTFARNTLVPIHRSRADVDCLLREWGASGVQWSDDRYVSDCCQSRVYHATVEMFDGPTIVYACDYCECACGVVKK